MIRLQRVPPWPKASSPFETANPFFRSPSILGAIVRILPTTLLEMHLVEDAAAANALTRNEILDGSEIWHRAFTRADIARCADGGFANGMVSHEFCTAIAQGRQFPYRTPLIGGGTGFAVTPSGHILTNYHLVAAEVEAHGRTVGALNMPVKLTSLRVQIADLGTSGALSWRDAESVHLVSNPPTSRAIQTEDGRSVLREDIALLRISPAPPHCLTLRRQKAQPGETVAMLGFPLRTSRAPGSLRAIGYTDADGSLRVTFGQVLDRDETYFTTDTDGSMGNSGSPIFDSTGQVVGLFSRAAGNGPRNATEYGHMTRINVDIELAISSFDLTALMSRSESPPAG